MILLPLLTERSLNQGIKAIDQDLNLRLRRRDQNFNGQWVGLSQNGQAIIIRREQGILTIEKATKHLSNTALRSYLADTSGRSLLSIATTHCQRPGKLILELLKARAELMKNTDPEISWESWLKDNFAEKNRSVRLNNDAVKSLQQLKKLVEKACSYEPALADVVMLNQISDCLIMLGMDEHAEKCEPQNNMIND